jgi:hypothetical protein
MGIKGEEIETKGIDYIFNNVIEQKFSNPENGRDILV